MDAAIVSAAVLCSMTWIVWSMEVDLYVLKKITLAAACLHAALSDM